MENSYTPNTDYIESLEENYFKSTEDIYYNIDKIEDGTNNIIYVTGFSGSGKSTLRRDIEDNYSNSIGISLDRFTMCILWNRKDDIPDNKNMDKLYKGGKEDLIYYYLNNVDASWRTDPDIYFNRDLFWSEVMWRKTYEFMQWLEKIAKTPKYKNNIFVVEGMHIALIPELDYFKNKTLVIKGTSAATSYIRKQKRDLSKSISWDKIKNSIIKSIPEYIRMSKNMNILNDIMNESSIKRSEVDASDFGLLELRKYPMPDKDHVLSAIKFFNYVSPANEKELAINIKKKMKQYNISPDKVGKKNRLKKYLTEDTDMIQELCFDSLDYAPILVFDIGDVLVYYKKKMIDAICSNKAIKYGEELWEYIMDTFNKNSKYLDCCSYNDYVKYMTNNAPNHLKQYITTALSIDINNGVKFDYTDSLLRDLKSEGYPIYYLSNWSRWSRDALVKNNIFDFLKYFDGGIFSCDCGLSKPDEKIYKKLFEKYNLNPGHTIFFDDRHENISTAINCGMTGILFDHKYTPQWIRDYFIK